MKEIIHRYPPIEKAEIRQMVNGPESFPPDGKMLIGEVPEVWQPFVFAIVLLPSIPSLVPNCEPFWRETFAQFV